jgi:hypothetical protein
MGWQASVADQRAALKDELSRQDLVRFEQLKLQNVQAVDSDLRGFGEAERHGLLSGEFRREAHHAVGAERRRLAAEAVNERHLTDPIASELRFIDPTRLGGTRTYTYDVKSALTQAESGDANIASLEPNPLRVAARQQRTRGLHLTGLAVIFILGLAWFTLAAITRGKRAQAFACLGAAATICAVVLFPIVRLT